MNKRQPSGDQQKSKTGKHRKKSQRDDGAYDPFHGDAQQQSEPSTEPSAFRNAREDIEETYGEIEGQQTLAQGYNPYGSYMPGPPPQPHLTPSGSWGQPEAGTTPAFGSYGSAPRAKPIEPSPYGMPGYTPGQSMSGYTERSTMPPPEPRGSGRSAAPIGPSPYRPLPYAKPVDNPGQSLARYPGGSAAPTLGSLGSGRSARPTEPPPYGPSPYGRPGDMPRQSIVNPEAGQLFAPTPRRSTTFSETLQPEFGSDQFSYDPPIERPERHHFVFTPVPDEMSELAKGFARHRQPGGPDDGTQQGDSLEKKKKMSCARCYIVGASCSLNGQFHEKGERCSNCRHERIPCTDDHEEVEQIYGPPNVQRAQSTLNSCVRCHVEGWRCSQNRVNPCPACWKSRIVCMADREGWELERSAELQDVYAKFKAASDKRNQPCARCYIRGARCDGIGLPKQFSCSRCAMEGIECNEDRSGAEQIHGRPAINFHVTYDDPCERCDRDDRTCSFYHWPCLRVGKQGGNASSRKEPGQGNSLSGASDDLSITGDLI